MKLFASAFLSLLFVFSAFADHHDRSTSSAQAISNFVSIGGNSSLTPGTPQAGRDLIAPTLANLSVALASESHHDIPFSSADCAAFFASLSAEFKDHHFDSLSDLQTFVDNLHLDPALLQKIHTLVADFQNGEFEHGDNSGGHDMNSGDDNHDQDMDDGDQDENDNDNEDMDEDHMPAPIPEPSTFAMILAGAGLLGGTFLRRRLR